MKIGILSQSAYLYSTKRLVEAGITKGHQVEVIDYLKCSLNVNSHQPNITSQGENIANFDVVIPRIDASKTFYGLAIVRQLESMGITCINDSGAISRSRDKLNCLQILAQKGIPIPKTVFVNDPENIEQLIEAVGGAHVVIKLLEGSKGIGVVLAQDNQAAISIMEAFHSLDAKILVQEFIQEAKGVDIRCFVVGDGVVTAVERQGAEGEFRSNLHRGGSARKVQLTSEEISLAVNSAQAMGLQIAGVDLLRSKHGSLVIEVNSSPGLQGIEKVTGIDVASKIIEFLERSEGRRTRDEGRR